MKRVAVLSLISAGLTGCFVLPSMQMQESPDSDESIAAANEIQPHFIPITIALIEKLQKNAKNHEEQSIYYRIERQDVLTVTILDRFDLGQLSGAMGGVATMASAGGSSNNPFGNAAGASQGGGNQYLVEPDGNIFIPLIGFAHVAGKTPQEVREQLVNLASKYIRDPQVDVHVTGFNSRKFYIMGEVGHGGVFPITNVPVSITDAINLAGGLNPDSANPSQIYVIRGDYRKPDVYWLNAQSPKSLLLGEQFYLQPHDVLFVSTAGISRWNRTMNQVLPTVQTLWFTKTLVDQA